MLILKFLMLNLLGNTRSKSACCHRFHFPCLTSYSVNGSEDLYKDVTKTGSCPLHAFNLETEWSRTTKQKQPLGVEDRGIQERKWLSQHPDSVFSELQRFTLIERARSWIIDQPSLPTSKGAVPPEIDRRQKRCYIINNCVCGRVCASVFCCRRTEWQWTGLWSRTAASCGSHQWKNAAWHPAESKNINESLYYFNFYIVHIVAITLCFSFVLWFSPYICLLLFFSRHESWLTVCSDRSGPLWVDITQKD